MSITYKDRELINVGYWLLVLSILSLIYAFRNQDICYMLFIPLIIVGILMLLNRKKAMEMKKEEEDKMEE